jgi:succinoglycan biosynthesis protein ExoW
MAKKVAVITPFFQRQPGLLNRAIQSAVNQKGVTAMVEFVVVDDGSPLSAEDELSGLALPETVSVRVIKQENAGCYPACNTALDNVTHDTDYVAFLDSDDEWFDMHLGNAIWALQNGYEFYFSDFYQLNQSVSAFCRGGRLRLDDHKKIHATNPIYEFVGSMFDQILKGNVLCTSTIVYYRRKLGDLRYLEHFRHTGAEYILWLNMAARSNRIAFLRNPSAVTVAESTSSPSRRGDPKVPYRAPG